MHISSIHSQVYTFYLVYTLFFLTTKLVPLTLQVYLQSSKLALECTNRTFSYPLMWEHQARSKLDLDLELQLRSRFHSTVMLTTLESWETMISFLIQLWELPIKIVLIHLTFYIVCIFKCTYISSIILKWKVTVH